MTVVVDASVVVAALVSTDATGKWAESVLAGEPLAAPHLMPVEAASILHRAELAGEISADAASLAHADLRRLRVEYFPYDLFAERIWELRDQYQSIRQQADRLAVASQRLEAKITNFRLRQQEAGERSGHPGLTSYEAWYVALAEFLGTKLATLDTRLALVPGLRCGSCLPPPPPP
jgi:predicted nucleic acid-binding protein